jgi:hypothetical protein
MQQTEPALVRNIPDGSTRHLTSTLENAGAAAPTVGGQTSDRPGLARSRRELIDILRDERFDQNTRLLRLQGQRGAQLDKAVAAGRANRLAPTFCAIGATAVVFTESWELALALMVTAVIGIFARNHPIEAIYNSLAPSIGRARLPRNRAAKRLGCMIGTLFLGASALSIAFGASILGQGIVGTFAVVAVFVSITNFCIPSAIFVALFGGERSTACKLF